MINLSKGQKLNLDKGVQLALVGLGWDPNKYRGSYNFDLDASVFMLDESGKLASEDDIVYYGNPFHYSGAVRSTGDDTTGDSSDGGDDEKIIIDFSKIPAHVQKLVVTVSIYDAETRRQNFGQVSNAYVRVVKIKNANDEDGEEVVRYELDEEFSSEIALTACEITRNGGQWSFGAVGTGYNCDLGGLCEIYGLS